MKNSVIVSVVVIVLAAFYLKSLMYHGDGIADIEKMESTVDKTMGSTDMSTKPVEAAAVIAVKPVETAPATDAKPAEVAPATDATPAEAAPATEAKPAEAAPATDATPADTAPEGIKPVEDVSEPEGKTADGT